MATTYKDLNCSFLLIGFYFFILLTSAICGFIGIPLNGSIALGSAFLAIAFFYVFIGGSLDYFRSSRLERVTFILIIAFSILVSILIFDNSYDGQTYHYETITALRNGWIPFKGNLSEGTTNLLYINHYAKGFETAAAAFTSSFGHPESGKALNIILLISCFLYVHHLLTVRSLISKRSTRIFVAALIALNPVTVYQLFTYYVDGQIASVFTLLCCSCYLAMRTGKKIHFISAAMLFCIMSELKFTGLIYAVMIFGFFALWQLIKKTNISKWIITGAVSVVISIVIIGYHPYITNTIEKSNPFYPLLGKDKVDVMTTAQPASFEHKNRFVKFFEANFSRSHNIHGHAVTPEPVLKVPFFFRINEWLVFKASECRMAGYGPWFGGILLITFILFFYYFFRKGLNIIKHDGLIIAKLIGLTMIINPEMWFSRYSPQLWLLPFCAFWLFKESEGFEFIKKKLVCVCLVLIGINISIIAAVNWGIASLISYKMHKEISWLKTIPHPVQLKTNDFISSRERLSYYEVPYVESVMDTSNTIQYKLQSSNAVILLPAGVKAFENTDLLKVLDKKLE